MQEKMVYAGQLDCYSNSEEVLLQMLDVEVSAMQVYRVTDTYGTMLEEAAQQEEVAADILEIRPGEVVYGMADGTMILTRQGWSEAKLGRIFRAGDCIDQSKDRGWIRQSLYEGYLGGCSVFTDRFERKLDCYEYLKENLVFITDGAVWIKNWLRDAYPQATIILDFYHAYEHLCDFAKEYFKEEKLRHCWLETQKALLLDSGVTEVIANIEHLKSGKKKVKEMKKQLLAYYLNNLDRMDYKRYAQIGAGLIGSGPIESAHRQVIQKRMKQSGQRWSPDGAQSMLQLRCCRLSGKWGKVISLICSSAKAA